jgi:Family of unknown function (DUF5767)
MQKSPFSFNHQPKKFGMSNGGSGFSGIGSKDMLFNKKKISSDVMSMSSSASSSGSSVSSDSSETSGQDKRRYEQDDDASSQYSGYGRHDNRNNFKNNGDDTSSDDSDGSDASSDASDASSDKLTESTNQEASLTTNDKYASIKRDQKDRMKHELNEKRELLYQMDRLESKGYRLPFKFSMESDIHEMRSEYNKIIREKEIDASVRFQRKMLMAFVSGTEYLNTRYDPFAVRLEGWSEQVHENITDYDDIFEELHNKYRSTGKKMSPELRLFISLSGSAFMFHLTNRMFKESPLPNVEHVLKSNPELMKQFQAAAAKQYVMGQTGQTGDSGRGGNQETSGLFGMVSNLFNNMGGGPRPQPTSYRDDDEMSNSSLRKSKKKSYADIDNIINNVHSKISFEPQHMNNIETLSVSDEEITSIIEDTADMKILRNTKKNNTRTLNL